MKKVWNLNFNEVNNIFFSVDYTSSAHCLVLHSEYWNTSHCPREDGRRFSFLEYLHVVYLYMAKWQKTGFDSLLFYYYDSHTSNIYIHVYQEMSKSRNYLNACITTRGPLQGFEAVRDFCAYLLILLTGDHGDGFWFTCYLFPLSPLSFCLSLSACFCTNPPDVSRQQERSNPSMYRAMLRGQTLDIPLNSSESRNRHSADLTQSTEVPYTG